MTDTEILTRVLDEVGRIQQAKVVTTTEDGLPWNVFDALGTILCNARVARDPNVRPDVLARIASQDAW